MIAKISSILNCTDKQLWSKIIKVKSLQCVASPILYFKPINNEQAFDEWSVGQTYKLKLFFFKYFPLGRHNIKVIEIDKNSNVIETHESGLFSPVWNHKISFENINNGLKYTDKIEIKAGVLTLFIWIFANYFYRHRQRKWKKLLKKNYVS